MSIPAASVDSERAGKGPGTACFRPAERLHSAFDYRLVRRQGQRTQSGCLRLQWLENGRDRHRLGLVVQKRFWNAVQRNRIKRRIREAFRTWKNRLPLPPRDFVVIALPGAEQLKPEQIGAQLQRALTKGKSNP